jgi:hypothetical protein
MWITLFVDNFILYVPQPWPIHFVHKKNIFIHMEITVDTLSYEMTVIEDGRIRIDVSLSGDFPNGGGIELGSLYFERAKKSFQRKPIGMDGWACVDAKIEGLYIHGGEHITPKDIVRKCQQLIKGAGY